MSHVAAVLVTTTADADADVADAANAANVADADNAANVADADNAANVADTANAAPAELTRWEEKRAISNRTGELVSGPSYPCSCSQGHERESTITLCAYLKSHRRYTREKERKKTSDEN